MRRFKRQGEEGTTGTNWLGSSALPAGFADALEHWRPRGSVCAVSRVAQHCYGNVSHVEWGVTTPSLCDWVVEGLNQTAIPSNGVTVFTLCPTGSGFARGPHLVVDERGQLAISEGHPPEWNVWMLARLNLPSTLN